MLARPVLRALARRAAAPAAALVAALAATAVAAPAAALPELRVFARTYYVSPAGHDLWPGTTPLTPFRSLERASQAPLRPGDRIVLQRGGTFAGGLTVAGDGTADEPVVVGAYGAGAAPVVTGGTCVRVTGSYVVVEDLEVRDCDWSGIEIEGAHVTVRGTTVSGNIAGITVGAASTHARILDNTLRDNDRMVPDTPGPYDDYGAYGVEVLGDHAEIAYNHISGHVAPSADFGADGSAVELYGAVGTSVHHNTSVDNLTFTELGHSDTTDSVFAYNTVRSSLPDATFLVTRGDGALFGPVRATVAEHNSASLTGPRSQAFWCGGSCGPDVLTLESNVLTSTARIGYAGVSAESLGGGHNVLWGSVVEHPLSPGDLVADPRWVDPLADLALRAGSPAVDHGRGTTWTADVSGARVPTDGDGDGVAAPDSGAHERR